MPKVLAQIFCLTGHDSTVNSVKCQAPDPQIVTASADTTVRTWDLRTGKTHSTLTNHKKGVRALAMNEREFTFASASADNIKVDAGIIVKGCVVFMAYLGVEVPR